jgi:hypothetical protein
VPRGGVVNARRPGRRPGRSEAESVDDVEHGASIECAMVERPTLRLSLRHFVHKIDDAHKPIAVRFVDRLFPQIRTHERARGRRVPPAQLT